MGYDDRKSLMYLTQWHTKIPLHYNEYRYLFDITKILDGAGSPFSSKTDSIVAKL